MKTCVINIPYLTLPVVWDVPPRLVNRDEEDPIQDKADEAGPEWVESHAVLCHVVLYPAGVITKSLSVSEAAEDKTTFFKRTSQNDVLKNR